MARDESDEMIVRAIVDLARGLNLRVLAEGVETEAAWHRLAAIGCDEAQGYWLSRPVSSEQLTEWLAARVSRDATT
jgi:EAL domain-containing protein (putative c-di-GMP-specific phosphodiesterase class I)